MVVKGVVVGEVEASGGVLEVVVILVLVLIFLVGEFIILVEGWELIHNGDYKL